MRLNSYKIRLYSLLSKNKTALVYLPLGVYWIFLFIMTTIPSDSLPSMGGIDKLEHLSAYTLLGFLIGLTAHFQNMFHFSRKELFLVAFSIAGTYAILDELHQIPIKGRYFDWIDLLANFIGIMLGLIFLRWFLDKKNSDENQIFDGTNE